VKAVGCLWQFGGLPAAAIGVMLVICPAAAQNNSLLNSGRGNLADALSPPSSQPATAKVGGPALTLLPGFWPQARPRLPQWDEPPPNPVLLLASPIAVEPPRPRKIGVNSLVTIIIRESRTTLNDAKMKAEKDWEVKAGLAQWFRLDKHDRLVSQGFPNGAPGVDFTFDNKYDTKGKYDRKDELTTRITAKVIDVKPNGNLVLEARKRIKVGDEEQIATLTGECRSEDVTAANTVLSTQIANLTIEMPDQGAVRDATRRGWLMRLFDFLRPL
jgi:flagellar L-ring protein precursor FlgH